MLQQLGQESREVGAAHEGMVELKRYEIATLPSSGLRAGLSVARNDNLAAGGAAALGGGPEDQSLGALRVACGEDTWDAGYPVLVAPDVAARSDDAPAAFDLVWSTSAPSDAALPSS